MDDERWKKYGGVDLDRARLSRVDKDVVRKWEMPTSLDKWKPRKPGGLRSGEDELSR